MNRCTKNKLNDESSNGKDEENFLFGQCLYFVALYTNFGNFFIFA
jgi:hypothetical protein